jgi:cytochrome P450
VRSPFFDPAFYENPYPAYARLRAERPLDWCRPLRAWTVTRYADISALLRDPRVGSNRPDALLSQIPPDEMPRLKPLLESLQQWVVLNDPPTHTEVRAVLMRGLSPRVLDAMRPRIQTAVDELLASVEGRPIDFVREVALPLPAIVIAELLGVPTADRHRFRDCSRALALLIGSAGRTAAMAERAQESVVALTDYLRTLTAQRRASPGDGFLDALIAEQQTGSEHWHDDRLAAHVISLLFAAHETTANLLGNMLFTLLRHPDELARLRADLTLIPQAVEECVRFESPGHALSRIVRDKLELHGQELVPGDRLLLFVGSANRDPEQFVDPDRFDVTRTESRHVGFGYGIHFCAGATLARMEAQIVLARLLAREPRLESEPAPRWQQNLALRGLENLHVQL